MTSLFAQGEPAKYMATAANFKKYYNANTPDSISKNFSPEMLAAIPADKFKTTTAQLKTQLGPLLSADFQKYSAPLAVYKATFQNAVFTLNISLNSKDQITGLMLTPYQGPAKTALKLDPSLTESPVLLKTLTGTIAGTLTTPTNIVGKIPVVLIIAGSGPTDRDGNTQSMGVVTNSYKMIAEALGKDNIASLRYDKRMVGESATGQKEDNLRFDDYVDDAIGLVNLLKDDKRFSKVIVLGHSEGSLVGMLATIATEGNVNAFISVAGAGRRADEIMKEQMKSQPTYVAEGFKKLLDSLARGKVQKKIDPSLYFIARPSIQYFLMSWCKFDPSLEIKKIKAPILIIQGSTDIQVSLTDANNLKKAKSAATLTIVRDMNYILKEAPLDREKNMATYKQPELPLKPEFVTGLLEFIHGLK
ncbi:MAG: alpha/beta hydrolase [Mucilaginibacter sp.]|nr:alpha/beta hydrolase [Mucilaginibacter sp.]